MKTADIDVIQMFIKDSLERKSTLTASPTLRSETHAGINQLISKTEGVLVNAPLNHSAPKFWVRLKTNYLNPLSQMLAEHGFIPSQSSSTVDYHQGLDFLSYEYLRTPTGCNQSCSRASLLWKAWRQALKYNSHHEKAKVFWVRQGSTWRSVQEIVVSNSLIYINTDGIDQMYHAEDLVCWLVSECDRTQAPRPSLAKATVSAL